MKDDEPSTNGISNSERPGTSAITENIKEEKAEHNESIPAHEEIDLDDILVEMGTGKFQIFNYLLILLAVIVCAMYDGQYVFNARQPDQRCLVEECESTPPEFKTGEWKTWAISSDPEKARCFRYVNIDGQCKKESFSNVLHKCVSWLYENNGSIAAEFDLGCQEWKRTSVGAVHGLGLMTAFTFIGAFSDLFGRRSILIATSTLPSVLGTVRGLSNSYYMYLVFEYLQALAASGVFSTGYILALEMIGTDKRVLAGTCLSGSYALGQLCLAFIAWLIPYWRTLTFVLYVPSILFLFYYFCLVESVRWLMSQGRKREAAAIIFKGAAINGKTLRPETITYLKTPDTSGKRAKQKKKKFLDEPKVILRSRILLTRLMVIAYWFATVSFIYYGLSINAESLSGDKYANYAMLSLIEFPGYIINVLTLDRFGRKKSITASYVICAIALSIMPFTISIGFVTKMLAMISKMFISMVYSATYLYVTELAPTEVRHTMMALGLIVGRLGKSCAPLSPMLLGITPYLPYIVFSVTAWIAAALTHWTPETKSTKMPETLDEAEHLRPESSMSLHETSHYNVSSEFWVK